MSDACDEGQPNDSGSEMGNIYNAIQQVAAEASLDHRFILAIIMQESGGCVRVQTTNYGFNNPGLMQSFEGTSSCDNDGELTNPCPQSEVRTLSSGPMNTNRVSKSLTKLNRLLAWSKTEHLAPPQVTVLLHWSIKLKINMVRLVLKLITIPQGCITLVRWQMMVT
jgi:2,3-bisphosphoglycerate-independent phosphoglycerate mutase